MANIPNFPNILEQPIISNVKYDALEDELRELDPEQAAKYAKAQ